jgi:ribosome-associated toxin RatA of RatAB toxin-antitoxin module
MSHQIEVTTVVAASPEQVYALVSDLPNMGRFSPENTGGKWVKGASGPALGAKFEGTNALGRKKWKTLATVTSAEPGKQFAFDVVAAGFKVAGWGFAMEPVEGGTKVTHFWDDHRNPVITKLTGLALGVKDRPSHNQANMERTLEGVAAAV